MNIEIPQNSQIVTKFFAWALTRTGKDSIHLLEVGSLLHEWNKQTDVSPPVMQAEGVDSANGAAVGQRSVGTVAGSDNFYCWENDTKYEKCSSQCDECKSGI